MTSRPGNSAYSHQTQTSWTTIALQGAYTSTRWCAVAHTSAQTFAVGALAGSPVEADNPVEAGIPVEAAGTPREALDTPVEAGGTPRDCFTSVGSGWTSLVSPLLGCSHLTGSDWTSLASSLLGCCSLTWSSLPPSPTLSGPDTCDVGMIGR